MTKKQYTKVNAVRIIRQRMEFSTVGGAKSHSRQIGPHEQVINAGRSI